MLSFKLYGRTNLWWILARINDIVDVFNDLEVSDVIKVPDIVDIEDFYLESRKLIRQNRQV